jgi:prepilin-type N-terminal cleavage/methylation domain-containing protein/prepilin-type processing-associated H-X9-DG protein
MNLRGIHNSKRGFTLVELLVVIAIIGLLVAILLPALSSARNSAQAAGSGSNLSAFGRGFMIFATEDKQSRLSTGAFDHLRDGDCRKTGWVADIIRVKVSNPGKALDPGNSSQVNEKVADYIGAVNTTKANGVRWNGKTSDVHFGGANGPTDFTASSTQAQKFKLWEDGYNSNYATTWHFSRGDVVPGTDGKINSDLKMNPISNDPSKCPLDGDGPLSEKKITGGGVSRDRIALMGASRNGDGSDALVTSAMFTTFETFFGTGQKILTSGAILVESFTDGMNCPFTDTALGGSAGALLHEINDIVPIHSARKTLVGANTLLTSGYAQVLFADGHVAKVEDTGGFQDNPDSWLGPYKSDGGPTTTTFAINKSGYDETRELIWLQQIGNSSGGVGGGAVE